MLVFAKSHFWKCFFTTIFLYQLCGCYSTSGALQSARTAGKGEFEGIGAMEFASLISDPRPDIPDERPHNSRGARLNLRYGIGERTDLGIYLNWYSLFPGIFTPTLILVGHQVYLKQRLTPENSKIAISGMFGITETIGAEVEDEEVRYDLFIPRTTIITSSNSKEGPNLYGGWGCIYGHLYGLQPESFENIGRLLYIGDEQASFIHDLFLGWEGKIWKAKTKTLLEADVTFHRHKPLILQISVGYYF